MSGNLSRSKGARRELQVVRRFQDACISARKVSRMYRSGDDLEIELASGRMMRGEVKARANGSGFKTLESWKRDADLLFVVRDRAEPMVVLDLDLFIALLGGENAA